jgi:CheY-like chemotaxis protein/DNA-binding XRE family transcriptional regulator
VRNRSILQETLGRAVRSRRHELGLSQEELAWRAGLNRTYVTDVERGARNLSLSTVDRLAQALQMPLSVLMKNAGGVRETGGGETGRVDILLVEDNPRDVELTLRALRRSHLANFIQVARDGVEALEYLFCEGPYSHRRVEDHPSLVLLDLKLPRLDGMEVLRRMKGDPRTTALPVVVLTSSDESRERAETSQLGVSAYIVKPVDFHRLSQVTPSLNLAWTLHRAETVASAAGAPGLEVAPPMGVVPPTRLTPPLIPPVLPNE